MSNIHKQVQTIIGQNRAIQKNLSEGLVNNRALARYLQENGVNGSLDAIISAIRRFETEKSKSPQEKKLQYLLKNMIISTKSNIICLELKDSVFTTIAEDFIGKSVLKNNFRMIKSKENVRLYLNQKNHEAKTALFQTTEIIHSEQNLSEIRLIFPEDYEGIIGLLARIGLEMSLESVCIQGIIETMPEILLYVKEEDLVTAHKAMINLTKEQ